MAGGAERKKGRKEENEERRGGRKRGHAARHIINTFQGLWPSPMNISSIFHFPFPFYISHLPEKSEPIFHINDAIIDYVH